MSVFTVVLHKYSYFTSLCSQLYHMSLFTIMFYFISLPCHVLIYVSSVNGHFCFICRCSLPCQMSLVTSIPTAISHFCVAGHVLVNVCTVCFCIKLIIIYIYSHYRAHKKTQHKHLAYRSVKFLHLTGGVLTRTES